MTEVVTFEAATVSTSTPKSGISFVGSSQPGRQLDVQVWTAVTTGLSSDRPHWRPTLVVFPGLRHALSVRLYETGEDVAVEDPETGVFGAGDDLDAAIVDFQAALHEHLDVLTSEDALAPPLQHQLEILRGYFGAP
jgi:hypothetical protein